MILTDFTYLVPPSYRCGILALRSHDFWEMTLNSKTRVKFVYVLPNGFVRRFFIWNKIFIQPRGKYFTYINHKYYFLLWLFQLRWTLIQHVQVFHGEFESRSGQTKDYKTGICCLSARHVTSRRKDWLARNHDNVSEWRYISTHW